jgi:hypothetical protein
VSLLWRSGALSNRTSPPEISTRKSVNSEINHRLPRASVISIVTLYLTILISHGFDEISEVQMFYSMKKTFDEISFETRENLVSTNEVQIFTNALE